MKNPTKKPLETLGAQPLRPSMPALALATRLCNTSDVYQMAEMIDLAFDTGFERAREEEKERIFKMSPLEIMREFFKGKRLRYKTGQRL